MSRGGPPPYRERDYTSDRYKSGYGSDSRTWSTGQSGPSHEFEEYRTPRYDRDRDSVRDREREWTRLDWERYQRERYERDRTYGGRQDRRDDEYSSSNRHNSYADRRSESYGWDERERDESRRWSDARDPRDPREATDRWYDSRYQSRSSYEKDYRDRSSAYEKDYRDRSSAYEKDYRDRFATDRPIPSEHEVDGDRSLQRYQRSGRRSRSPYRSHSPRSATHRSSPSSSRRHSPPPNASSATVASNTTTSLQNAPTGPRDASNSANSRYARDSWTASSADRDRDRDPDAPIQQPPTGPRRSFARPPPFAERSSGSVPHRSYSGVQSQYDDRSYSYRTPTRSSYDDQAQSYPSSARGYERSSYSKVPGISEPEGSSVSASQDSRREGLHPRDNVSHLQIPTRSPAHGPSSSHGGGSGPATPAIAGTPDGAGSRKPSESQGSGGMMVDKFETQIYSQTLERIRDVRSMHDNPTMQSLRKALHELADSDVELEGARTKSRVTEQALEKAREEAEAWSIESARLDLEHRKNGSQGYWNVV